MSSAASSSAAWVQVSPHAPYFMTEDGRPWTPIGQNDAVNWPDLKGLFRRRDVASAERYLQFLASHGVTCLRLMMEYCQFQDAYFEKAVGVWNPVMVQWWDDLFGLCEKHGLRVLMTPYDTFFMWIRWDKHPYNVKNGGFCQDLTRLLLDPRTLDAASARLQFASERWGGSPALFAWDLWNEIHPSYAGDSADCFAEFIGGLSTSLREFEVARHGRSHPQTVSMFGPHVVLHEVIGESIYRHPLLDFHSTHLYEEGSIDFPKNSTDCAVSFGRLVRECIDEVGNRRPYFDSEHGPIHTFKDHHITLPEHFDDEYFRHMQWAHLASGGAGGGMRWPNRNPHVLTPGMRRAQKAMADFLPQVNWPEFRRRNVTDCLNVTPENVAGFACADDQQALVYLLRTDCQRADGTLDPNAPPLQPEFRLCTLKPGEYRVTVWDTTRGAVLREFSVAHPGGPVLAVTVPELRTDCAVALRRR